MGFDRYFSQKARHTSGSQHFGYDIGILGWDTGKKEFRALRPGTSGSQNQDHWGWGQPLYAMADGTVIRVRSGLDDNPRPGQRAVDRRSEALAGPISALAVTRLSSSRAASVARNASGRQQVIVWETGGQTGEIVTRKGDALDDEPITQVAADALTGSILVTAARTVSGQLKLVVWNISSDANTVTRLGERLAGAAQVLTLVKLSASRFATAVRTGKGTLRLMVWEVVDQGQSINLLSQATAGEISAVSLTALSSTRLATAVRTAQGQVKIILWDLLNGGQAIDRQGDATGEMIKNVSMATLDGSLLATALHLSDGRLRVVIWKVADDATGLTRSSEQTAGKVKAIAAARVFDGTYAGTAVVTQGGRFKFILWEYESDGDRLERIGENEAGTASLPSFDYLDGGLMVSGVSTVDGDLKVIIWWLGSGGGNSLLVLHGDELVLYAHFQKGSTPAAVAQPGAAVHVGQLLGRMGNSGSSSGPHLHIHAAQAPAGMPVAELIEKDAAGTMPGLDYRPLPFHNAQALELSALQPGILTDNPFAVVNDQGLYFERMAIWPGLTTPGIPTGGAELAFHGVRDNDYQHVFDQVTGAGYRLNWFDAFADGTDLHFNVVFRPQENITWSAQHNLTSQAYQNLVDQRKLDGFRPTHVHSYIIGSQVRYAAIFHKSNGVAWSSYHGVRASTHQAKFDQLTADGFVPVNVSVVTINGERQYTALYEKRNIGSFILKSFLTRSQYQKQFTANLALGRKVSYIDAYQHNSSIRFSVIWTSEHPGAIFARHNLTSASYQNAYNTQTSQGFLTQTVTGYTINGAHRYAGVWVK